jgi:hypothetical protein
VLVFYVCLFLFVSWQVRRSALVDSLPAESTPPSQPAEGSSNALVHDSISSHRNRHRRGIRLQFVAPPPREEVEDVRPNHAIKVDPKVKQIYNKTQPMYHQFKKQMH